MQRRGRGQEARAAGQRRAAARGERGGGGDRPSARAGRSGGDERPGPAAALQYAAAGGAEQRHPLHGVGVQLAVVGSWGFVDWRRGNVTWRRSSSLRLGFGFLSEIGRAHV